MSAQDTIYRTSGERTAKMMAIMLGICIAGGVIFFAMWDYWISELAPITQMGKDTEVVSGQQTGIEIPISLSFVESADQRTLAFNALPGSPENNPVITASVGDRITFDVVNDGVSFHSFGVTADEEGFEGVIAGTEIADPLAPLSAGEGGVSEFIPAEEGTYYYICTVPGHRQLGMVGEILVGPAEEPPKAAAPTGVSHEFQLDFVESDDILTLGFNALPGEDGHNPEITVSSGDTVTITAANTGVSFHSFGIVRDSSDPGSVLWDSEIAAPTNPLRPGESGDVTFTAGAPGAYRYICTVPGHAIQGMDGTFIVE